MKLPRMFAPAFTCHHFGKLSSGPEAGAEGSGRWEVYSETHAHNPRFFACGLRMTVLKGNAPFRGGDGGEPLFFKAAHSARYSKIASGRKADTVTLGRSTMLLTLRSTATLQMT